MCALCDSTLLMIGRERLSDVQLQFAQKRFYSLKTMVENTPYARHLPQDIVCKLTDAVEIKEFAGLVRPEGSGFRVQIKEFCLQVLEQVQCLNARIHTCAGADTKACMRGRVHETARNSIVLS